MYMSLGELAVLAWAMCFERGKLHVGPMCFVSQIVLCGVVPALCVVPRAQAGQRAELPCMCVYVCALTLLGLCCWDARADAHAAVCVWPQRT